MILDHLVGLHYIASNLAAPRDFLMAVPLRIQFILFLWLASMISLIVLGAIYRRKAIMSADEQLRSNMRIVLEIRQIELHRPTHIMKGDNHE